MNKKEEKEVEQGEKKSLADMIMTKLSKGDFEEGKEEEDEGGDTLDPKVVSTYKKLGVIMKTYRSGKLPKAFLCIPYVANWEELLYLTNPPQWSPHATFEATKIFASNLNTKMA